MDTSTRPTRPQVCVQNQVTQPLIRKMLANINTLFIYSFGFCAFALELVCLTDKVSIMLKLQKDLHANRKSFYKITLFSLKIILLYVTILSLVFHGINIFC